MGHWVRYKLDRQVDHVLVDEAQDTNAAQWEIIEQLVDEFFSGSSESESRNRTLFMVGDLKQAIYGFQGTDPRKFREAREAFKQRAAAVGGGDDLFSYQARSRSSSTCRSPPAFARPSRCSTSSTPSSRRWAPKPWRERSAPTASGTSCRTRPGSVELWEPFAVEASPDDSDEGEERWVALRDRQYAEELAKRVRSMIEEAPILPRPSGRSTPGDILILVRSRGELASLIVARLFSAGVPVAGVDRLHLHEPLAVQDLSRR